MRLCYVIFHEGGNSAPASREGEEVECPVVFTQVRARILERDARAFNIYELGPSAGPLKMLTFPTTQKGRGKTHSLSLSH